MLHKLDSAPDLAPIQPKAAWSGHSGSNLLPGSSVRATRVVVTGTRDSPPPFALSPDDRPPHPSRLLPTPQQPLLPSPIPSPNPSPGVMVTMGPLPPLRAPPQAWGTSPDAGGVVRRPTRLPPMTVAASSSLHRQPATGLPQYWDHHTRLHDLMMSPKFRDEYISVASEAEGESEGMLSSLTAGSDHYSTRPGSAGASPVQPHVYDRAESRRTATPSPVYAHADPRFVPLGPVYAMAGQTHQQQQRRPMNGRRAGSQVGPLLINDHYASPAVVRPRQHRGGRGKATPGRPLLAASPGLATRDETGLLTPGPRLPPRPGGRGRGAGTPGQPLLPGTPVSGSDSPAGRGGREAPLQ